MKQALKNRFRQKARNAFEAILLLQQAKDPALAKALTNKQKQKTEEFQQWLKGKEALTPWELSRQLEAWSTEDKHKLQLEKVYRDFCSDYRSYIRKFPALVRNNSLISALSFARQKSKEGSNAWASLEDHIGTYLLKELNQPILIDDQPVQSIHQALLHCDVMSYRLLRRQAIAFAEQLADYAVGMLPTTPEKKKTQKEDKASMDNTTQSNDSVSPSKEQS